MATLFAGHSHFLADRKVQLTIDNTQCPTQPISSGVPQGSPVSPILFAIYLSGVFGEIERTVPGVHTLSFADDIGLLAPGYSVQEACKQPGLLRMFPKARVIE